MKKNPVIILTLNKSEDFVTLSATPETLSQRNTLGTLSEERKVCDSVLKNMQNSHDYCHKSCEPQSGNGNKEESAPLVPGYENQEVLKIPGFLFSPNSEIHKTEEKPFSQFCEKQIQNIIEHPNNYQQQEKGYEWNHIQMNGNLWNVESKSIFNLNNNKIPKAQNKNRKIVRSDSNNLTPRPEIKNVLQQLSSSIQNCLKDGHFPSLTLTHSQSEGAEGQTMGSVIGENERKIVEKMENYLDNPSEHNIASLLTLPNPVCCGLKKMFQSRILKKYIQCSKIRTLHQKSLCLEALDYLHRCLREKELCSLHTWAHKREGKVQRRAAKMRRIFGSRDKK